VTKRTGHMGYTFCLLRQAGCNLVDMTKQGKHRRNLLLGHRRTENYRRNKNPVKQALNLIAILSTFRFIEIIGVGIFHPGGVWCVIKIVSGVILLHCLPQAVLQRIPN
jgi:hypothetical protein